MAPLNATGFQMIRTVEINNFRCFEALRAEGCRRLNLVVGDNGVGKTSLLEAIFLALANTPHIVLRFREQRGWEGSFSGDAKKIEEAIWGGIFRNGDWKRSIRVGLTGDGPEARAVAVSRGRSQLTIPLEAVGKPTQESLTAPIVFAWRDSGGQWREVIPKVGPGGLEIGITDETVPDAFYFPGSQAVRAGETAERFSELRRSGRSDQFVELLSKEYPWIEKLDIEVVAGSHVIYARLKNQKIAQPLPYVSGGINRTIAIMLCLAFRDRSTCLVDEIDDGIFYKHHEETWRIILTILRKYDGQLFATTHSDESIRALIRAAAGNVEDIALWKLERGHDGRPALFQFEGSDFKDAVEFGAEARGE